MRTNLQARVPFKELIEKYLKGSEQLMSDLAE